MEKRISVIMCIYSEKVEWLRTSIESVLNQTFSDFEFIIINDNPNRELNNAILAEYQSKDKRIVIITNEVNIGLTKSLNIGIKIAKGDYIARMDADDISLKERLELQVDYLNKNEEVGVCSSFIGLIGETNFLTNKTLKYPKENNSIKTELFFSNAIAHPTVMFRRQLFSDNNLYYNEDFKRAQDYDLWSKVFFITKFHTINKILLNYRLSNEQVSSSGKIDQILAANKIRFNLISSLVKEITPYELMLHNKLCNCEKFYNQREILDLDFWFLKLNNPISFNYKINDKYLIFRFNKLLMDVFIKNNSFLKSFSYFKTKTYQFSKKKVVFVLIFFYKTLINLLKQNK
jgi:glycosyltransferase involved in cell wall biosynthesis